MKFSHERKDPGPDVHYVYITHASKNFDILFIEKLSKSWKHIKQKYKIINKFNQICIIYILYFNYKCERETDKVYK